LLSLEKAVSRKVRAALQTPENDES